MKNVLLLTVLLSVLSSCTEELDCCEDRSGNPYNVAVVDDQGRDLMDPNTPNYIDPNIIRLYRMEGGEESVVTLEGGVELDSPYGVMSFEEGGSNWVRLFFGYEGPADEFTGIIQWSENERDVLEHKFNRPGKDKHLVQILRNGEILWDVENNPLPFFILEK